MNRKMVAGFIKPSTLIHGIRLEAVGESVLFKFSEDLQSRMESLLDKQKMVQLNSDELAELDALGELDQIFVHINAMLAAHQSHAQRTESGYLTKQGLQDCD